MTERDSSHHPDSSHLYYLQPESVSGGPVTSLYLPCREFCLWNQGSYLHRSSMVWNGDSSNFSDLSVCAKSNDNEEKLLVFPAEHAVSIHGIRTTISQQGNLQHDDRPGVPPPSIKSSSSDVGVVFGGRLVTFVGNILQQNHPMSLLPINFFRHSWDCTASQEEGHNNSHNHYQYDSCLVLSDWIYDCQLVMMHEGNEDDDDDGRSSMTMIIGLAHNIVQLFRIVVTTRRIPETSSSSQNDLPRSLEILPCGSIRGCNTSIAYSLTICPTSYQVAVGSVKQEVYVWSMEEAVIRLLEQQASLDGNTTTYTIDNPPCQHHQQQSHAVLKGHKGAIHAVQFDTTGNRLVSASDDRTVRLWSRRRKLHHLTDEETSWYEAWVGWGHESRCWSAIFFDQDRYVCSTGEDGTARLWNVDTGAAIAVVRGHSSQSIWSISTWDNWAVTGANDGSLAFYDLSVHLNDKTNTAASCSTTLHLQRQNGSRQDTAPATTTSSTGGSVVVTGMDFYARPNDQDPLHLLVATQCGSLLSYDTVAQQWSTLQPWHHRKMITDYAVDASDMSCLSIHPSGSIAAIGTTVGYIFLVSLDTALSNNKVVATCSQSVNCVKKLEWINETTLLSYQVRTVILWSFDHTPGDSPANIYTVLTLESSGIPKCGAWNAMSHQMVVGDTRGSLSLFRLSPMSANSQLQKQQHLEVTPTSSAFRSHGKEHVNDVIWVSSRRLLSVGNNGCICEHAVADGQLSILLSIPLSSFTGLERLWSTPTQYTVVGGYYGNTFALKLFETGNEYIRIDTGGRQRLYCIGLHSSHSGKTTTMHFAVAATRPGGGHDIQLTYRRIANLELDTKLPYHGEWERRIHNRYPAGVGLHGEAITDVFFHAGSVSSSAFILTGSEDCSSRVSIVRGNSIVCSKLLPSQMGGVRSVSASQPNSSGKSLLVVGGSGLVVQFFAVSASTVASAPSDIDVQYLGRGRTREKPSIDHRINAVAVVPVANSEGDDGCYLVATGDSNGGCYLYRVASGVKQREYSSRLLFRRSRPILSLAFDHVGQRVVLVAGTSGGELIFHDVKSSAVDLDCQLPSETVLCRPHTAGTNCLSTRVLPTQQQPIDDSLGTIRICTGGDDQAIYCCDVILQHDSHSAGESSCAAATVVRSVTAPNACGSAVRGISWVDDNRLCVVSYDQQLQLFELQYPSLKCLAQSAVRVGSVNSFSCASDYGCESTPARVAVAGTGLEIFSVIL